MDGLLSGSTHAWLSVVVTAFGPLIALLVGFVRTDQWLRRRLNQKHPNATEGNEGERLRTASVGLSSQARPAYLH
jgi:hypothetical protein